MFTEAHRIALQEAVNQINRVMADIRRDCGDAVVMRPFGNYDADAGFAEVEVEVTTGRIRIVATHF